MTHSRYPSIVTGIPLLASLITKGITLSHLICETSHEAVNKEIAYRWSQEVAAMGKLFNGELEMVYKMGFKQSEYLANKG